MGKENNQKVSIIIPLYNQKQFVAEAIESCLNQSYPNTEIIVINDGSADNPQTVLDEYKYKIIVINQKNKGLAGARNSGLKKARGEFIQFLDADDTLHKDKIKIQMDYGPPSETTIPYCAIGNKINGTNIDEVKHIPTIKDMFAQLYNLWNFYPLKIHSLLFSKHIFKKYGRFDEKLEAAEDRLYLSKLVFYGVKFVYIPFIGGIRRMHDTNMTKDPLHIIRNCIGYYKKINRLVGNKFLEDKFAYNGEEMINANFTFYYINCIKRGDKCKVLKKIKKLFNEKNISINFEAIPKKWRKSNKFLTYIHAYFVRYLNKFTRILNFIFHENKSVRKGTLLRWQALKKMLKEYIKNDFQIYDMGSYDGYIASKIKSTNKNISITVVDIDKDGLKKAKKKGLNTLQASATKLPIKDNSTDFILCNDLIEHVKEDDKVIGEISRVLKPGGKVLLTTPKENGITFPFISKTKNDEINRNWGHVRKGYSLRRLERILKQNNLEIVNKDGYFNSLSRFAYWFCSILKIKIPFKSVIFKLIILLEPYFKINTHEHILVAKKK